MRQHRREHMVVPARILPHFIVVHPQVGFAFFTALFNRPAHAADKQGEPTTEWDITLPGSNREIFGVKELHLTSQLRRFDVRENHDRLELTTESC